jgi:hypothetical protein
MSVWAITGGRDYTPTEEELVEFCDKLDEHLVTVIIHGKATGVDTRAGWRAFKHGVHVGEFAPHWEWGKRAGHARNGVLVRLASGLFAFKGGRGTADCIRQAQERGIPVIGIGREIPQP